jgi:hypothetical protein
MRTVDLEKSVFEIWRTSLPKLRPNRFNLAMRSGGAVLGALLGVTLGPPENFAQVIGQLSGTLAGVWSGLLGFVIAGFAIFTQALDPGFMSALWNYEDEHSGFPHLKVRLLIFVQLFIYLFLGMFTLIFIHVLAAISPSYFHHFPQWSKTTLKVISMAGIGFSISTCIVELKALIFNLYSMTLTQAQKLAIDASKGSRK